MDMDMSSSSSMSMAMTTTTSSATASASSSMGMRMGMGGGNACKISMLWNWYTIDACFLSSQWHVRSSGGMAGACIGVISLVIVLEALRRGSREYDSYITRAYVAAHPTLAAPARAFHDSDSDNKSPITVQTSAAPALNRAFTPNLFQQLVRAFLHMLQFAVAYFVMLLAMYFNGYIIICILIGAFLGAFIFSWHRMSLPGESREITFCCS